MRYIFIVVAIICCQMNCEELFSVSWKNIEKQSIIGPQSIAVDSNNHIYILCNLSKKILVFSSTGKLLETIHYDAEGCGLAVDGDDIVIFSPMGKTLSFIRGENKGQTTTLENLAAIAEVWKENNCWWARCGWDATAIGKKSQSIYENSFANGNKIFVQQHDAESVFTSKLEVENSIPIAHGTQNNSIYLNTHQGKQRKIVICDTETKELSIANTIRRPNNNIFCNYYIKNEYLYQIFSNENGFIVTREKMDASVEEKGYTQPITPRENKVVSATAAPTYIDVLFQNEGIVRRVKLQDYLKNVVSAEIYGSWSLEAHRAMAVTARTYAIGRKRHSNANVCTTTHCQAWKANVTPKATQGVNDTNGVLIYHNGRVISEALYFAHCNGRTRNSEEKWNYNPYLRSKYCACGKKSYYGHGVGACQYGLQAYSMKGWSYKDILEHYYTNTVVK